jgi:hypothetical protein
MDTLDLSQLEELPITGNSSSFSINWNFILIFGGVFILGIVLFYAYKYFTNKNDISSTENFENNIQQHYEPDTTPIEQLEHTDTNNDNEHGENDPNNINYCVGDKCYM